MKYSLENICDIWDDETEMKHSLEKMYEIWNDETGEHIEIGPDRDGIDLIEIRSVDDQDKITARIRFTKEEATLICQALGDLKS